MTDRLRVILEIGTKRRVVAGPMDRPGLDRWGAYHVMDHAWELEDRDPVSPRKVPAAR